MSDNKKHVAARLLKCVREEVVAYFSKKIVEQQAQKVLNPKSDPVVGLGMSAAGRGKVRYIGGRSVAKLRSKLSRKVANNINKLDKASRECVMLSYNQINLLKEMTSTELELEACEDIASLEETSMRQNVRHGLTNISDKAQDFFMTLVDKLSDIENIDTLKLHGSELPGLVQQEIWDNKNLFQKFVCIFSYCPLEHKNETHADISEAVYQDVSDCLKDLVLSSECVVSLYKDITCSFSNVYHNQLRKNYLGHIHREKKDAHRKQIMKAKSHQTSKTLLSDIYADTSAGKHVSHLQLKASVLQDRDCFLDRLYTRAHLIVLCKSYALKFSISDTKKVLNERLVGAIMNSDKFVNVAVISSSSSKYSTSNTTSDKEMKKPSSPKPGPSTETSAASGDEETYCKRCKKLYHEEEEWVGCDKCDGWFHRLCAGIKDDTKWNTLNTSEINWYCAACSKKNKH